MNMLILFFIIICVIYIIINKFKKKIYFKENLDYDSSTVDIPLFPMECGTNESLQGAKYIVSVNDDKLLENVPPFLPEEYDLSSNINIFKKIMLPPVKNQGYCGSCWAFSAATLLTHCLYVNKYTQDIIEISAEGLVNCLSKRENNIPGVCLIKSSTPCRGCNGCRYIVFNYFYRPTFVCKERYKPYNLTCFIGEKSEDKIGDTPDGCESSPLQLYNFPDCDTCNDNTINNLYIPALDTIHVIVNSNINRQYLTKQEITLIKKSILKYGPLIFIFSQATSDSFISYTNLQKENYIYTGSYSGSSKLNHFMVLVGWGKTQDHTKGAFKKFSQEYWIVRNSWGTDWGINGYIRFYIKNNIFYGNSPGSTGLLAIQPCRTCIPLIKNIETDEIICNLDILDNIYYINNSSNVTIKIKAYIGKSLLNTKIDFTINSEKIDSSKKSNDHLPSEDDDDDNKSEPYFYVVNHNVYTKLNSLVTALPTYFYVDENGTKKSSNIENNKWFVYKLNININELIFNYRWILKFTLSYIDGDNKIDKQAEKEINWNLEINIKSINNNIIQFEVLNDITEKFFFENLRGGVIEFPNNNLYSSSGFQVNTLPIIAGIYNYRSESFLYKKQTYFIRDKKIISNYLS